MRGRGGTAGTKDAQDDLNKREENEMKEERVAMAAAEAGFTLIEILLVVAIIGMMAAVAAVNLGGQMGKAQVNAAKSSPTNTASRHKTIASAHAIFLIAVSLPLIPVQPKLWLLR